jgi:hypothetical protein
MLEFSAAREMGAFMKNYLLAAALFAVAAPVSATTPLNVAVGASARAVVGANDFVFSGQIPAAWGGPGVLGIGYVAVAGDETYNITTTSSVTGNWLSADAGTIDMNWGWVVSGVDSSGVSIGAATNEAPAIDGFPANWFYEFTATGNGFFQGTYAVTGSGPNTFGLQPMYLWTGSSFLVLGGDIDDPTGAGSFAVPLVAGQTYRMILFNFGNVGTTSLNDITGSAVGRVQWEIATAPIPEASTWAMLIAGFGLVGTMARRRRPQALIS